VYSACAALRYLGISKGSAMEWCCACKRILMTSMGVTTATASVTPAERPAVGTWLVLDIRSLVHGGFGGRCRRHEGNLGFPKALFEEFPSHQPLRIDRGRTYQEMLPLR